MSNVVYLDDGTPDFYGSRKKRVPHALWVRDDFKDEVEILPRAWIARGYLIRGSVTILSGAGGGGKSMLCLCWALSLALGREWGRFVPDQKHKVILYNVEDDEEEQQRRIAAACRQFGIHARELNGQIATMGPIEVGTLLELDEYQGIIVNTQAMDELINYIEQFKPGVVFLDPLRELHTLNENDNTDLRSVIAKFRSIAQRYGISIVILHHSRKGTLLAGDMDSPAGAGAIVGAARVVLTLMTMSDKDAEDLGISKDGRHHFFRVDGAKANYSSLSKADWFEKIDHQLDNGEWVSAATPWEPPVTNGPDLITLTRIMSVVGEGYQGEPWSPALSGEPRSIRSLLRVRFGVGNRAQEKLIIQELERMGMSKHDYRNRNSVLRGGLRTPDGLPEVKWDDAPISL